MNNNNIIWFIIIIAIATILALVAEHVSFKNFARISLPESEKMKDLLSSKQNGPVKINPKINANLKNKVAYKKIESIPEGKKGNPDKIDFQIIQFFKKELKKKFVELKQEKGIVSASIFPVERETAKNQEKSYLAQKISPILSKPFESGPSSTSQIFPRHDSKERVLVRIRYENADITKESIEQKVNAIGGEVYAHIPKRGLIEAYLPQSKLTDFGSNYWIKRIDPVGPAISRKGSVATEGDNLLGVQIARQQYNIDGDNIKIGVISTGVDNLSQSQATGDLPLDVTVLATGGWFEPDDEGTAILEIIHDLAPGAKLFFHDGGSETRFIMGINEFINSGCDIIIDDIGYFFEPYFEDGIVAQEVANAVENGVVFVSAAGNQAKRHAEVNWRSSHDDPNDLNLNEILFGLPALVFPDDNEEIVFELGPYHGGFVALQWSERFGFASHDYDIFIYEFNDYLNFLYDSIIWYDWEIYGYGDWYSSGYWYDSYGDIHSGAPPSPSVTIVLSSEIIQNGSGDPLEAVQGFNDSSNWTSYMMVVEAYSSPSTSDHLEMNFVEWGYTEAINLPGETGTPTGSIFGHAAVPGVITVGAINVNDSGLDNIEPFSSQGPCYVPFSSETLRPKPDICAVDGVSVTGVGGVPSPFFGTSAAAPHVAAIAALLKDYNASLSSDEIRSILKETAYDLGASGYDSIFGYGRINIQDAIVAATYLSLEDAIIILKMIAGLDQDPSQINDFNGDSRIGMAEAIYILQKLSELR